MTYAAWGEEPDTDVDVLDREPELDECDTCCRVAITFVFVDERLDSSKTLHLCHQCWDELHREFPEV